MQQDGTSKLSRKSATTLIPHIKVAAKRANLLPNKLYKIEKLAVFGSYVSTRKPILGDLDVAVLALTTGECSFDEFITSNPVPASCPTSEIVKWPFWAVAYPLRVARQIHISAWNVIEERDLPHRVIFRA
jgi:hypothetical protein